MVSDAFAANNIGEPFDPEEILVAMASGEPVEPLLVRSDQAPLTHQT